MRSTAKYGYVNFDKKFHVASCGSYVIRAAEASSAHVANDLPDPFNFMIFNTSGVNSVPFLILNFQISRKTI